MTVTVEVKNQRTFDLLKSIEGLGLIHVNSPVSTQTAQKTDEEEKSSYRWLRGCHKGLHNGSVEDFLADCRADKEHELEIERRQEEERARHAKLHT
jgi:transposase-like protein